MPDCGSEGALGRVALVLEELVPGTSCRGHRVEGKGSAGTMATTGEWRSRASERKTKRRVMRGRSRQEEAVDLIRMPANGRHNPPFG
jgi:hypothetical protein